MVANLTGQQFGYLTVLEIDHKHNSNTYWKCLCKCGNEHITVNSRLISGRVQSCGCKRKEHTKQLGATRRANRNPTEIGWAYYYATYAHNKNAKQLGFDLTMEKFQQLCSESCHYCGIVPSLEIDGAYAAAKRSNRDDFDDEYYSRTIIKVNGIDRIDSTLGYINSNIVPCCSTCNFAKSNRNYDEFVSWITKVYQHLQQ